MTRRASGNVSMDPGVFQFAEAARSFCTWAEETGVASDQDAQIALKHLTRLYHYALYLPEHFGEEEAEDITDDDWRRILERFSRLSFRYYSQCFNPLLVPGEEPVIADLADDIADIWRDVKRGLRQFDSGAVHAATWEWRFNFSSHWGSHASGAIFALHSWISRPERI